MLLYFSAPADTGAQSSRPINDTTVKQTDSAAAVNTQASPGGSGVSSQPALKDSSDVFEELSEDNEDLDDNIDDLKDELDDLQEEIEEQHENKVECMIRKERLQKGSFNFTAGFLHLDIDPLVSLKNDDGTLKKRLFDFKKDNILMLGLMGLYNEGKGLRIGITINGGYKTYESDIYKGIAKIDTVKKDTTWKDSIVVLRVIPALVGFNAEKVFYFGKFSVSGGFLVGGGATVVIKNNEPANANAMFVNGDESSEHNHTWGVAYAPSFVWDVHAGLAFALAPAFHVGIDGLALFTYAANGFGPGSDSFVTVNPGLRIRLIAGK